LAVAGASGEKDEPIPDKVGTEVHLSKTERGVMKKVECSMCKAILTEMHVEVKKHRMTKGGFGAESQVWETANAICLAMLQKWRLDLSAATLERKPEDEDEQEMMARAGANPADHMRAMLVLKMGCQQWVEDYGGETSGYVFKTVRDGSNTAEGAAQDFCTRSVNLCGKGKKEKRQKEKEKERQRQQKRKELLKKEDEMVSKAKEEDPLKNLPEDSKLGLQRMLEMAKDDPMHYMEESAKQRVQQARADLRCDVCRAVLEELHSQVSKRPKSQRSESDILPFAEEVCDGGKDLSVPNYFGVEPPPLPPVWTDRVRPTLDKKSKQWVLKKFPKKAAKERRKWRELSATGQQKPPPPTEGEGDMMLTLSCKDVLEAERMAEFLYKEMSSCTSSPAACMPALAAARSVCRAADGAACHYRGPGEGSGQEL